MSKNIVIFSDGTGQEGGFGDNTNVYKLFNLILDRSGRQISFYDKGVGTGWRKATGNIAGRGFSKNIIECYRFIFENYEHGDKIFLFGFSRGAATVRSLAGFIHLAGILPRSRGKLIKEAWKIYKIKNDNRRTKRANAFHKANHTMWAHVEFLGVWDTVAALGVPSTKIDKIINWFIPHGFHNFRLSESVRYAYHALAIDDRRKTFHPVFFRRDLEREEELKQTVRQVWFMGMHTDVGGGYAEGALSDVALEWMLQQAVKHGLLIYDHPRRKKPGCKPDPDGRMHDSLDKRWKRIVFKTKQRWCDEVRFGRAVIHESVKLRTADIRNTTGGGYEPWILKHDPEIEPWTHLADWKKDPAFKDVDAETMKALENWSAATRPERS